MSFDSNVLLNQLTEPRAPSESKLDDHIGRAILGGLRHENSLSELQRDCFGLFQRDEFIKHIQCKFQLAQRSRFQDRFQQVFEQLVKEEKIEIRDDKIRALYGHSLRGVIVGEMKWPKTELFHATRKRHLDSILKDGLRPQRRTWVHLMTNERYADTILRNHDYEENSVLLRVVPDLLEHFDVTFRKSNSHVWLANRIPPFAIKICEPNGHSVGN